jgi:hypothetical protein
MRENADRLPLPQNVDARKFERKRVPLAAKLTDLKGHFVVDCTVRDISVVGAQVAIPNGKPIPDKVFLIDLKNRVAYMAHVPWWRPQSAGLAFQETYKLDGDLPPQLLFLKEILIESKLKEVESLTAEGRSLSDAVEIAGLTGATYVKWSSERARESDLMERLWKLEAENSSLKRLFAQASDDDSGRRTK